MTERIACRRCERPIDRWARLCPFCNWNQSETPPPRPVAAPAAEVVAARPEPPVDTSWRAPALVVAAIGALLVSAFAIGSLVQGNDPLPAKDEPAGTAVASQPPRANITLVPDDAPIVEVEEPITTAPLAQPAEGVQPEYQRNDATAASSEEYAQLAKLAAAEKKSPSRPLVDPRTISGVAYAGGALPAPRPRPQRIATHLRPTPEHQPLPDIEVSRDVTARLELIVGTDGRVHDVRVREAIPGNTAKLIAAIQSWRFKPATENGVPVAAPFTVDISFNADE